MRKLILIILIFNLFFNLSNYAQTKARYSEEQMSLQTYPFSNPNPVPELSRIYPYYRFNEYAAKGTMQNWKMVVLENDYIKLWITPEIGGKIWGAIEKSTGKEFIYFNHAVKFRDIAMRGPWTSGGLEFNFGVIGHAPSCSSPVDYLVRENPNGSVSCFVGSFDLPSGTRWSVEINLPADKAYFTTRCIWDNPTMSDQSYYHWTNLGIKTAGNLEYAFPGNAYLGHDGKSSAWPTDKTGRDLHFYENNNFGTYKSYHVFGEVTNFYGGFWHNDNFGFGHYSPYDEKPGKKIWIWGLSEQGMIWEDLLTDKDGQYTELQSGRLFNQEAEESTLSPFKHKEFRPGTTDEWTEYWFPVIGIKGLKNATPQGSVNLSREQNKITLAFCPNEAISGTIEVRSKSGVVFTSELKSEPLQVFTDSFSFSGDEKELSVWVNHLPVYEANREKQQIKRPVEMPADFNWESVYGHYLKGKELDRQRYYKRAELEYLKALALDKWYVPALNGMAGISYREMDYQHALDYAQKALSIDTYDADANMKYALASLELGDTVSAIDGFSIASSQVAVRSAAYNGLATIFMKKGEFGRGLEYAEKSLLSNSLGAEAVQLKVLGLRKTGRMEEAASILKQIERTDPLNHFVRIENWLSKTSVENKTAVRKYMTNEFPVDAYLRYALWYMANGQNTDALKVLSLSPESPESPEVLLWTAYLSHLQGKETEAKLALEKALQLSPEFVFPSGAASLKPLVWAGSLSSNWKINYYKGLILLDAGAVEEGTKLWLACGNSPDYYPFYMARSQQSDVKSQEALNDVEKALQLSTSDWRVGLFASKFYLERGDTLKADELIRSFTEKYPQNYYLGLHQAKMLELTGKFQACVSLLQKIQVLPNEGATEGRNIWRNANLGLALDQMAARKYQKAIESVNRARQFPANLGVGRPYEVDERLEDFVSLQCFLKLNDKKSADLMQRKISGKAGNLILTADENDFLTAWVLKGMGNALEGDKIMTGLRSKLPDSSGILWCDAIYSGQADQAKKLENDVKVENRMVHMLMRIFAKPVK